MPRKEKIWYESNVFTPIVLSQSENYDDEIEFYIEGDNIKFALKLNEAEAMLQDLKDILEELKVKGVR